VEKAKEENRRAKIKNTVTSKLKGFFPTRNKPKVTEDAFGKVF